MLQGEQEAISNSDNEGERCNKLLLDYLLWDPCSPVMTQRLNIIMRTLPKPRLFFFSPISSYSLN